MFSMGSRGRVTSLCSEEAHVWRGGNAVLRGPAGGLHCLRLCGPRFPGEVRYYLSTKCLWPAWPPPSSRRSSLSCLILRQPRGSQGPPGQRTPCFPGRRTEGLLVVGTLCPGFKEELHSRVPPPHQLRRARWGCGGRSRWAGLAALRSRGEWPPYRAHSAINCQGTLSGSESAGCRAAARLRGFHRPVRDSADGPAIINPAPPLSVRRRSCPTKARQTLPCLPRSDPSPRWPLRGEEEKAGPPGAGTADNARLV